MIDLGDNELEYAMFVEKTEENTYSFYRGAETIDMEARDIYLVPMSI